MSKLNWNKPLFTKDGREVEFMYNINGVHVKEYVCLIKNFNVPQHYNKDGLWSDNPEMKHLNLTNERKKC